VTARDVYRAVLTQEPYAVRMLMSFGTNVLVSQPDAEAARRALAALEFHVHADFFINTTASYADIVLRLRRPGSAKGCAPASTSAWKVCVVCSCVGRRLRRSARRADTDVVVELADRLGLSDRMFDGDVDKGHNAVLGKAGLSVAELRAAPAGVVVDSSVALDAHALDVDGSPRGFPTPTRKIELYSERLLLSGYPAVPAIAAGDGAVADARYPLRLGSAKTVAYCHSQHRNIASLRRLVPDPVVEIAPADAAGRGIAQGDWVTVETERGSLVARAAIVAGLAAGAVFGQHGWWVEGKPGTPYDSTRPLAANIKQRDCHRARRSCQRLAAAALLVVRDPETAPLP
jgi:anaerobic selenocysteine-containing dehydrogenase